MTSLEQIDATVIVVTYNHKKYLPDCLKTIINNNVKEVIIIDNNSTDGSPDFIEKEYPQITLIRNSNNVGFGAANNIGAKIASGNILVFLNPDTRIEKNTIAILVKDLDNGCRIHTPKIMLFDEINQNTEGLILHPTGLSFTQIFPHNDNNVKIGFSGACFAILKNDYHTLGGFDEEFFCYMEDTELSWRALNKGYKIVVVPESIVYHDYHATITPFKIEHLEKGRYIIIRKYFGIKDIIFLAPSLIMTEILTIGFSIFQGKEWIAGKSKGFILGLRCKVRNNECNSLDLLSRMNWILPDNSIPQDFRYKSAIIKIANAVYALNNQGVKK